MTDVKWRSLKYESPSDEENACLAVWIYKMVCCSYAIAVISLIRSLNYILSAGLP